MKFQDMPYERIDFAKVQEEMGELLRELEDIDLIERKRRGLGRPRPRRLRSMRSMSSSSRNSLTALCSAQQRDSCTSRTV